MMAENPRNNYGKNSYLAALAGVDPVVEAGGLVPAHPAQHAVVPVKLCKERNILIDVKMYIVKLK